MSSSKPPKVLSRSRAIAYASFGLVTIINLAMTAYQVGWAYVVGEGFDVSATDFIPVALMFLIVAYFATKQLTSLLAWLGLRKRTKQRTIIAEYDIEDVTPAEAGVMIDTFGGTSELLAILRGLETKGYMAIAINPAGAELTLTDSNLPLNNEEQVLIRELRNFGLSLRLPADRAVLQRAYKATLTTISQGLIQKGYMPQPRRTPLVVRWIYNILAAGVFILQLWFIYGMFQAESWQIIYPRYPLYEWQLIYIVALLAILIFFPLRALYQERYSPQGWEVYRQVIGLYIYMDVALKERLKRRQLAANELEKFMPYAIAFGLVLPSDDQLGRYI